MEPSESSDDKCMLEIKDKRVVRHERVVMKIKDTKLNECKRIGRAKLLQCGDMTIKDICGCDDVSKGFSTMKSNKGMFVGANGMGNLAKLHPETCCPAKETDCDISKGSAHCWPIMHPAIAGTD